MSSVKGNVEDSSNGKPLQGVKVSWFGKSATSNFQGNYEISFATVGSGLITFSKSGYQTQSTAVSFPLFGDLIRGASMVPIKPVEEEPEPLPPIPTPTPIPSYPKDIIRGPYTISVDNAEQETQAKEFLGISPAGEDLDTWLSKRNLAGLEQWKSYWTDIFSKIGMAYWIDFVNNKFEEFKSKIQVQIPPEAPPEKTWWDKISEVLVDIALFPFTVSSAIIDRIMFEVTGEHNTENVWATRGYEAVSFLTPLDELSKLFFGENLAGDPEEFAASEDAFNLIVDSLMFLPIGKVGKVGLKLSEKVGAKGLLDVAGRAGLKKASPEIIEALLKSNNFKSRVHYHRT